MNLKREKRTTGMRGTMRIVNWAVSIALGLVILAGVFIYVSPDYDLYVLRSESMTPTLNMGDVIIAGPASTSQVVPGAIITFMRNKELVTHRVVSVDSNNVSTKGDALEEADPWLVPVSDVKGAYLFKIPYLGYVTNFARTKLGWFLLIILPSMLLVAFLVKGIVQEALREEPALKQTRKTAPQASARTSKANPQPAVNKVVASYQPPAPVAQPQVTQPSGVEKMRTTAPAPQPYVAPPLNATAMKASAPAASYQESAPQLSVQQAVPDLKATSTQNIAAEMTRRKVAAWINNLGAKSGNRAGNNGTPRMAEITTGMTEMVQETTNAIEASASALEEWANDLMSNQEKNMTRLLSAPGNGKNGSSEDSIYRNAEMYK